TPNKPEAEKLTGMKIASVNDAEKAAEFIHKEYGTEIVVLDGPSEQLLNNPDIKEFYLGLKGERFSYKDVKYWKRKKRYL
ncbi:bifunctional hydroxymethylpyrimidine kinase/phosphomethylpyrimidine kinase, partial [Pyrobaculum aerophilum]